MMVSEPDSMADLMEDCAEMPTELRRVEPGPPLPRAASPWRVDDGCLAQVDGLDEYP